jgi:hypothetical protein
MALMASLRMEETAGDTEPADTPRAASDSVRCDHRCFILRPAGASSSEYFPSRISATIDAQRVAG